MSDRQQPALEGRIDRLTRLIDISRKLNSTLKLSSLLQMIMDETVQIVDAEGASVLLWHEENGDLRFAATTAGTAQNLIGLNVPLEGSIAGTIAREQRTVRVDDVAEDERHYNRIDDQIAFQTRSILGVPMLIKDRVIGVLEAVNKRGGRWAEDDSYYLEILAAQAAVAIESAQLVAALRKANEELSQVDKMKNDFIAIASHELRTPLGVILGYASFLTETSDPEVRSHADKVVTSALQLRSIIEDMVNLRYIEQQTEKALNHEIVPLFRFLNELVHDVRPLSEAKRHKLVFLPPDKYLRIRVDAVQMGIAFTNILNNAVRFTPEGGQIAVRVEKAANGKEVTISIKDSGIGIPKDQLDRIFTRFYQVANHMTRRAGGMGIGLTLARAIVEAHGGRIRVTSPGVNSGATFSVTLPLVTDDQPV